MPFEYAASYPREAEASLASLRKRLKQCFSLLHGKEDRELIDAETSIEAKPVGEGWAWELVISPRLQARMEQRAAERFQVLGIDTDVLARFKAFDTLSSNEPGQIVEINRTHDEDGLIIYEMWSAEGKAIATLVGNDIEKYDTWIRFKAFLPA